MRCPLPRPESRRAPGSSPALILLAGLFLSVLATPIAAAADTQAPLRDRLKSSGFKIAFESYVDNNWELFVMNADGSNPVNLTQSPKIHEHYPQVSPDGTKLCYSVDQGDGRETVRSLWVMDIDGKNRKHLADHAREPFWSPDSKVIGFLPQEFPKFNVIDFYTKGMAFYHLADGRIEEHPNATNLHHLYNPGFAPNGKWIVSTVHAGMGVEHGILLIEARGNRILNLGIPGCRPCISPDGKQIAWGSEDHEVVLAPLDTDAETPTVGPWRLRIQDHTKETYHVDWSPDSRFVSLSRGPASKGDPKKPGTFMSACEIVGVYAPGWDINAVSAEKEGVIRLESAGDQEISVLTKNGASNKESSWFRASTSGR
ncbi:MAG: PD40 domain-containing protein [Verrucomicrobiales bacterium]|nr:PD40 domain-containing protein [Verrucomicrobiales bacterium]